VNGPEHYTAADKLLSEGLQEVTGGPEEQALVIAAAQAHATLALAAATAFAPDNSYGTSTYFAWRKAINRGEGS
jgi:hypothetical protein